MSGEQALPETQRAVVLVKPFEVEVQSVPTPKIESDGDVIIKVAQIGFAYTTLSSD